MSFSSAGFVVFFNRGSTPEFCLSGLFHILSGKDFLVIFSFTRYKRYFWFHQVQMVLLVLVEQALTGAFLVLVEQALTGAFLVLVKQALTGACLVLVKQALTGAFLVLVKQALTGAFLVLVEQALTGAFLVLVKQALTGAFLDPLFTLLQQEI